MGALWRNCTLLPRKSLEKVLEDNFTRYPADRAHECEVLWDFVRLDFLFSPRKPHLLLTLSSRFAPIMLTTTSGLTSPINLGRPCSTLPWPTHEKPL